MSGQVTSVDRLIELLLEKGTVLLVRAAIALAAFIVPWLLAGWAERAVRRPVARMRGDRTLVRLLAGALRSGWLVVTLVSSLRGFGINARGYAAVLGAARIAIGLAFQGTLPNFAAGLMLLLFRPF